LNSLKLIPMSTHSRPSLFRPLALVIPATLAAIGLLAGSAAFAQPKPGPVPTTDFVKRGNFFAPTMSPDGKLIVLTQRTPKEPRDEYATVVYQLDGMKLLSAVRAQVGFFPIRHTWVSDTRIVSSLAREFGTVGEPSATGELIAMNSDGGRLLYLYGYRRGMSEAAFGKDSFGNVSNDDGFARVGREPRIRGGQVLVYENPWGVTARTSRLYDVNTVTASRRTVTEISQPGFTFLTQADGQPRFAYGYDDNAEYAVFKLDDAKRAWQPFASAGKGDLRPFQMSADNSKLLGSLSLQRGPRSLVSEGIDGTDRVTLAQDAVGDIDDFEWGLREQGPFAAGTSVGAPKLTYLAPERSDAVLHKTLSAQFPGARVHFNSVSADGKRTLFTVSSDRDPGAVYVFDATTGKAALLFESQAWIQPERMAEQKPIHFKARDGVELHGYLTLPPQRSDAKLPLVLLPHGGPHTTGDTWAYDSDAQFLASRGYAVLQVNFRGTVGRGPKFEVDGYRQWGGRMIDDLVDGVRWAVAQGMVDDKRICAYGASFGAYASMMSAIRARELFKCAIGYAGVYDLPLIYDQPNAKVGGQDYRYYLKVLGQDANQLTAYSPSRLAAKLTAPVLLVHGGADDRAPPVQAEAMRDALIKAGRPPEWMFVSGEGHGFYSEKNRLAFYEKLEAFLAKHIGK
jgi:dienelactone hydrolase